MSLTLRSLCFFLLTLRGINQTSVYEWHKENSLIPPSEKPFLLFWNYWRYFLASVYERHIEAFAFQKVWAQRIHYQCFWLCFCSWNDTSEASAIAFDFAFDFAFSLFFNILNILNIFGLFFSFIIMLLLL